MTLESLPGLVPPSDAPNAQRRFFWHPGETLRIPVAVLDLPALLISMRWWLGKSNGREFETLRCGGLDTLVKSETSNTRFYDLYLKWTCPFLPRGTYELKTKMETGDGLEETSYTITVVNDPDSPDMKKYIDAYDQPFNVSIL